MFFSAHIGLNGFRMGLIRNQEVYMYTGLSGLS